MTPKFGNSSGTSSHSLQPHSCPPVANGSCLLGPCLPHCPPACLQLMAEGAQARRPQLFFCKLGKDRTGLLAALVLSACGASEEEIVADYSRSDGVDAIALGGLEKDKDMQVTRAD